MRYLIDTNIVIPLEPSATADFEVNTPLAMELHRLIQESGNQLCTHPAIEHDIDDDNDADRATLRRTVLSRYTMLQSPPSDSILNSHLVGTPPPHSNSWVDNQLLAALAADAVDFLVTEDTKMHRKAARLGLSGRTLYLNDAIALLRDLFDETPPPPPHVEDVFVYQLDERDPIFDSLRLRYPGFDEWLEKKCKRKHRKAYMIRGEGNRIAGLCIRKREEGTPDGRRGRTLKLCTFKVCDDYAGNRYGELLLKATFEHVRANRYVYTYFTIFPDKKRLIDFAIDFGFYGSNMLGNELVMVKDVVPAEADLENMPPIDLHIKYGPRMVSFSGNQSFIVPIRPHWHAMLFPECEDQQSLFVYPCGNSIKKAYLSHSPITQLNRGDNLFFYHIKPVMAVTAVGVVEATKRSSSADEIANFVGTRTVFAYNDIQQMCRSPVLAINFRLAEILDRPIRLHELVDQEVIGGPAQSISGMQATAWLQSRIGI